MGDLISLGNLAEAIAVERSGDAAWLRAFREKGRTDFIARGLPNRRVESWRFSDLARALGETVHEADAPGPSPTVPGAYLAVFENGILNEARSTLAAAGAISLRRALAHAASPFIGEIGQVNPQPGHAILSLNAALMEEGLVLRVPRGTALDAALHLQFEWRGDAARAPEGYHLRIVFVLEEGASAAILETHRGSPGFATIVSELRLARNATLTHLRLEQLGATARQTAATLAELGASATYRGFYLSEGGHFARHEALLKLAGEGAAAQLDGIALCAASRHCDNTTVVAHAAPQTESRQSFRSVLSGRARGVYQGCVKVQPDAQQTNARQMSRALLLSRKAEIATKPELEIFADDVKCSHGATAGELDPAALFFLRARGIPEPEARAVLVEAFLGEALAVIPDEGLRGITSSAVRDWLSHHTGEIGHVE